MSILEAVIFTQPQGCVLMAFTELILLPSKSVAWSGQPKGSFKGSASRV